MEEKANENDNPRTRIKTLEYLTKMTIARKDVQLVDKLVKIVPIPTGNKIGREIALELPLKSALISTFKGENNNNCT